MIVAISDYLCISPPDERHGALADGAPPQPQQALRRRRRNASSHGLLDLGGLGGRPVLPDVCGATAGGGGVGVITAAAEPLTASTSTATGTRFSICVWRIVVNVIFSL